MLHDPSINQDAFHLLLPGQIIIVKQEKRMLVLAHPQQDLTVVNTFSTNEWSVLLCLLNAFPQYALHEQLLACVVGVSMDVCRERLATAKLADEQAKRGGKESRCWEQEFRPASRALMRLRDKLKPFALTLAPARRLGYSLMAAPNAPGHEHWPRDGSITSAAHGVPPEQQSTGG